MVSDGEIPCKRRAIRNTPPHFVQDKIAVARSARSSVRQRWVCERFEPQSGPTTLWDVQLNFVAILSAIVAGNENRTVFQYLKAGTCLALQVERGNRQPFR